MMRKLLSIFLSFVMMATIFSTTSGAAELEVGADLNPKISFEIEKIVASTGKAWVNFYVTTDEYLDYSETTEVNENTGEEETTLSGSYISVIDVYFKLNSKYFTVNSTDVSFTNSKNPDSSFETGVTGDTLYSFSTGTILKNATSKKIQLGRALVPVITGYTAEQILASKDWYTIDYIECAIKDYTVPTTDPTAMTSATFSTRSTKANYSIDASDYAYTPVLSVAEGVQSTTTNENDTITWAVTAPVASINDGLTAKIESGEGDSMTKPLAAADAFKTHYTGTGFAAFNLILKGITATDKNDTTTLSILKTSDSSVLGSAAVK